MPKSDNNSCFREISRISVEHTAGLPSAARWTNFSILTDATSSALLQGTVAIMTPAVFETASCLMTFCEVVLITTAAPFWIAT